MTHASREHARLAREKAQDEAYARSMGASYDLPAEPKYDPSPVPASFDGDTLREIAALRRVDEEYARELEREAMDRDPGLWP